MTLTTLNPELPAIVPSSLTSGNYLYDMVKLASNWVLPINPFEYWTDSYKMSHILFETEGVTEIYSNLTPRFDHYLRQRLGEIYDGQVVVFGLQWMILRMHHMATKGFFDRPKHEVIKEMMDTLGPYIGQEKYDQFEALHDLGYLPVSIKTIDEGTLVPIGTPILTIRNTHPDFEWLPNFLETGMSMDIWKQLTVATIARSYRLISNKFALETTGSIDGTEFQNHDFGSRGASGFESCAISGAAFLLSSCGTDNIAALWASKNFYNTKNDHRLLAASVPAGEHSVTTSGILTEQARAKPRMITLGEAEFLYTQKVLRDRFPTGIVSYVADSFDYWAYIEFVLPKLKETIMNRDGKFVVRGDSGNVVDVICGFDESEYPILGWDQREVFDHASDKLRDETPHGEHGNDEYEFMFVNTDGQLKHAKVVGFSWNRYDKQYYFLETSFSEVAITITDVERTVESKGTIESLWDIFGGRINDQGYKVLDSHIGMIYGDGITPQRSQEILRRLKHKGFASTNIVFGVGSYSLNMISRDDLGMAIKATNTIVDINGQLVDKPIYKDPKTDTAKKSARGLLSVYRDKAGDIKVADMVTRNVEKTGLLTTAYEDSKLFKYFDLFQIRDTMWK